MTHRPPNPPDPPQTNLAEELQETSEVIYRFKYFVLQKNRKNEL